MTVQIPVPVADLEVGSAPEVEPQELLALYTTMSKIRAFEDQVVEAFKAGLIPGSTHPCIGQEAIKAAVIGALEPGDNVLATYRGHGEAVALGSDPAAVMSELMCRTTGLNKGKGGSMHLSDPSVGLLSTNAIVAGHIPMAGGVALSDKLQGRNRVTIVVFGDGASCEGEFFETLNMAQLWEIPLLFVCENNGAAISVPVAKSQSTPDIADRARGMGMHTQIADGNDVVAAREAALTAIDYVRSGAGPAFIEYKTVRWERHSAFSAGGTDADQAREAWQRVDPLVRLRKELAGWGVATTDELEAIDDGARTWAAAARASAEAAPRPTADSIYEDIFAPPPA